MVGSLHDFAFFFTFFISKGLGLPHHFWYSFLDKVLPGAALLTVAKKIVLDQATFSPFANFFFFMGHGLLEGNSVQHSWKEFKTKFPLVYKVILCTSMLTLSAVK